MLRRECRGLRLTDIILASYTIFYEAEPRQSTKRGKTVGAAGCCTNAPNFRACILLYLHLQLALC